jgi:hypothetical protein
MKSNRIKYKIMKINLLYIISNYGRNILYNIKKNIYISNIYMKNKSIIEIS